MDTARAYVERHHGVEVSDPYRWLEHDRPPTVAFKEAQDATARRYLANLPRLPALEAAVAAAARTRRILAPQPAGGRLFYVEADAAMTTPSVFVEDDTARKLLDGLELHAAGERAHIRLWPTPDGRRVAVGITATGERRMGLRVLDADSGHRIGGDISGLVAGRSSVAWLDGGRSLAFVRFDVPDDPNAPIGRPTLVVRSPAGEERVVMTGRADALLAVWARTGLPRELVVAQRSGDGRTGLWRVPDATASGSPEPLVAPRLGRSRYAGDLGDAMLFSTTVDAPRGRVISVAPTTDGPPRVNVVVNEAEQPIDGWVGTGEMVTVIEDRIFVVYRRHTAWVIVTHDDRGQPIDTTELPTGTSMWTGLIADRSARTLYVSLSGFADPGTVYRIRADHPGLTKWRGAHPPYDPHAYVTELVHYPRPGHDPAPMFLTRRRDLIADGARPVLVYGYGWGGWSAAPWFRPHAATFMDEGGIIALPVIRGGGERGEAWHAAGVRQNRPNAIADFTAACEWLAASEWSRPGRLVAEGQSAGGALVAMAVLDRPALFGAQLLAFPVLDMLRYERFTGAATWKTEFGTVEDPEDFRVLRATSPLHNVGSGVCAPPTLLLPGEVDQTTPPHHAYKYAAALRSAQTCDHPVLLRIARGAGHAYGKDAATTAKSLAAQVAFVLDALKAPPPVRR